MDFKSSTLEQSMIELTMHAPPGKSMLNSQLFHALTKALSLANGSRPARDCGDPDSSDNVCGAVIMSRKDELWENGSTIIYAFCNGTKFAQDKVKETIKIWEAVVNLQFRHEPDINKETHVRICLEFSGNWCRVGGQTLKISTEPTMRLASIKSFTKAATNQEKRLILHEWGHLLGLYHEHQSELLSLMGMTWDKDRTKSLFTKDHFQQDTPADFDQWMNKNVFDVPPNTNYSDFDPASIMTYYVPQDCYFLNDDKEYPIDLDLEENFELSPSDKAYMALHYPSEPEDTKSSVWKEALVTLKIPPAVSVGWNHENITDKFWRYFAQLRKPYLDIGIRRARGACPSTDAYTLITNTNLWEFQSRGKKTKEYSDFDVFRTELMKKGWTLPELPPDTEVYQVKLQALKAFVDKIAESIVSRDDDIRRDVCIFLQGQIMSGEQA